MPTIRRPKGLTPTVDLDSPYSALDDWLSVPLSERERAAQELKYGTLHGDEARLSELLSAPKAEFERIKSERSQFLTTNPNYTYEPKSFGVTEHYLKPIGKGMLDLIPGVGEHLFPRPESATPAHAVPSNLIPDLAPAIDTPPTPDHPQRPADTPVLDLPDMTMRDTPLGPTPVPTTRTRTTLNPDDEDIFQHWYADIAKQTGMNKDPDAPQHKYDMRAFWKSGQEPQPDPTDLDPVTKQPRLHFSSEFKDNDHPTRFILQEDGNVLDTKYEQAITSPNDFNQIATPEQKARIEDAMRAKGLLVDEPSQLPDLAGPLAASTTSVASTPEQVPQAASLLKDPRTGLDLDPRTGQPIPVLKNEPINRFGVERVPQIVREQGNVGVTNAIEGFATTLRHYAAHPDETSPINALAMKVREYTGYTPKLDLVTPFSDMLSSVANALRSSKAPLTPESIFERAAAGVTNFVAEQAPTVAVLRTMLGNWALAYGLFGLIKGSMFEDEQGRPVFNGLNMHGAMSGLVNLATIGILHGLAPTSRLVRAGVGATIGGGLSAAQGGSPEQIVSDALTFGVVAGLPAGNPQFMRLWGAEWNKPSPEQPGPRVVNPQGLPGPGDVGTSPPPMPPDLGPIPQPAAPVKPKAPRVGDRVNETVQRLAEQFPPSLELQQGPPKLIKKAVPQGAVPHGMAPPEIAPISARSAPTIAQETVKIPPPTALPPPEIVPPGATVEAKAPTPDLIPSQKGLEGPSVEDIHAAANARGIPWDNNKAFMSFTEQITGKKHLDDLDPYELLSVLEALDAYKPMELHPPARLGGTTATPDTLIDLGAHQTATSPVNALPEPTKPQLPALTPEPKAQRPATALLPTFEAAQVPRSQLVPEQNAEILARAEKAQADLEIAGSERGGRYFKETQGQGGTQEVTGLKSATAQWYKDATTGPMKLSKQRVDVAVAKILEDKGRDTGKDVQRIKELLLQDSEFTSSPFAPKTDADWQTLIAEATHQPIPTKLPVTAKRSAIQVYMNSLPHDPVKRQYAQDLVGGLRKGKLPPDPTNLVPAEILSIQRGVAKAIGMKAPVAETKPAKPVQQELAVPPPTIAGKPIIGREATPAEAPLFSKAAQTLAAEQTVLPEAKPEPTAILANALRTAADQIEGNPKTTETAKTTKPAEIASPAQTTKTPVKRVMANIPDKDRPQIEKAIAMMRVGSEGGEKRAAAGMDPRIMKVLGGNLYSGDLGKIAVKEMIQNAVDGIRALPKGREGQIDVNMDTTKRTIEVSDTGSGMTPEVATKELLDIGGSKKVAGLSGGFGIAKVAIFANADQIDISTRTEDENGRRIETVLRGSGEDWMDQSKGLQVETRPTSLMSGTTIKVTLRKDVEMSEWEARQWLTTFQSVNRLPMNVDVRLNGRVVMAKPAALNQPMEPIVFEGGTITLHISEEILETNSPSIDVLNNGLPQFQQMVYLGANSVPLPNTIVADFQSKAGPEEANYPFSPDRERLRTAAKTALDTAIRRMATEASEEETKKFVAALARAPVIPGTPYKVFDTAELYSPEQVRALAEKPYIKDLVEVMGKVFADAQKVLLKHDPTMANVTFEGIGLGDQYLGVNIIGASIEPGRKNLILLNPFTMLAETQNQTTDLLIDEAEEPATFAEQVMATIVHELSHQPERAHGEKFAGALTRNQGRSIMVSAAGMESIRNVIVTVPERETPVGLFSFLKGGRHDSAFSTLTQDLIAIRKAWEKGPDIFGKISSSHAGERGRGQRQGDSARRQAPWTRSENALPARRQDPALTLAQGPLVSSPARRLIAGERGSIPVSPLKLKHTHWVTFDPSSRYLDKIRSALDEGSGFVIRRVYNHPTKGNLSVLEIESDAPYNDLDLALNSMSSPLRRVERKPSGLTSGLDVARWERIYGRLVSDRSKIAGTALLDRLKSERGSISATPLSKEPPAPPPALFNGFDLPSETTTDLIRRRIQDKFIRVRRTQEAIKAAGGLVPEKTDVYLAEELFHGRVETRLKAFEQTYVKPMIKAINAHGLTVTQVEEYLYARHAPERNTQIAKINPAFREANTPGSGMTNAQAAVILERFDQAGQTAALDDVAAHVDDLNTERLRVIEEAGLESPETLQTWRDAYHYYVPLKTMVSDERPRTGKGFDIRGTESRRALGRKTAAKGLLAHTVVQAEETIVRAEKNRVGERFLNLARRYPNKDLWQIDRVSETPYFNARTGEVRMRKDPKYKLADNVFSVKQDGKAHLITIHDEALANAMKNLGAERSGAVVRMLASINRYLAIVNTSGNPEFLLSNFARDVQTAATNMTGEQSLKMAAKMLAGIPMAMKGIANEMLGRPSGPWGRTYQDFQHAGGKMGFFGLRNVDEIQRDIAKTVARAGKPLTKALSVIRGTRDLIFAANEVVENAVRLSAFKHAVDAGLSTERAASLAKNLTVNFNRKGELGPIANALWLFYNAGMQGTVRMIQALKSRKVQGIALGIVVASVALSALNRLLGGEDQDKVDRYDKVPDGIKERNLLVMRPDGSYFKLPLPYGYNVFHVLGAQLEAVLNGKRPPMEGAVAFMAAVLNAFNPIGGDKFLIQTVSPTLTDPLVDLAINRDWSGKPIKPEQSRFELKKPESQLYWNRVSPLAKDVSQFLNELTGGNTIRPGAVDVSPEVLDYLVGEVTGGAGAFVNRVANAAIKLSNGEDIPLRKVPFVRVFAGDQPEHRAAQDFFTFSEEVKRTMAEYEAVSMLKPGLTPIDQSPSEFKKEHGVMLSLRGPLREAEHDLHKLSAQRQAITLATIPQEQKTQALETITDQIDARRKEFNRLYRIAQEEQRPASTFYREEALLNRRLRHREQRVRDTSRRFLPPSLTPRETHEPMVPSLVP